MSTVIITTVAITLVGIIVGVALVYTGKKFHVEIDPRESAVRECLPGNNCGACGFAGCDAMAAAIAKGEAPTNGCPVGGQPAADKIAAVMGVSAEAQEQKVAFIRCKGSCEYTHDQANYIGVKDCRSAVLNGINVTECEYGCLGFGSCSEVCPNDAIVVKNGVAVVDRDRCVGCGLCVKACPRNLIELIPAANHVAVQCSNRDKGPAVKKVCSTGCIGCMLCTRQCESDAIHVESFLAHVDYAKCTQCGKCVEKCPAKVITPAASVTEKEVLPMDKKKASKIIITIVIICAAVGLLGGIFGPQIMYHIKNRGDLGPLTREDIDYENSMSYVSSTMHANDKNTIIIDYLEQDPYLVNIYEGFGFAKEYGSARGHEYTLEDVAATARPHALANCLTCKSANYTKLVNEQGVGVYTMDFNEVYAMLEQKSIGCYNCHGTSARNGGQLDITHSYVAKALGDDYAGIDLSSLTCGQCHIEYYFTPTDKETMMPYSSVATMSPEAILEYYDTMVMPDGSVGFYDWIQPGTGTKQLKAQHPELETFLQGKHAGMLSCADCHMAIEMADDGTVYYSHYLESPLANATILSTCVKCHGTTDMASMVHRIQDRITEKETEVGNKLSKLKDTLTAAVSEGKKTEAELDAIRKLHREAQWFFDFCYVENSEGAHNSELSTHCLDVAEQRIEEAMALLQS